MAHQAPEFWHFGEAWHGPAARSGHQLEAASASERLTRRAIEASRKRLDRAHRVLLATRQAERHALP
jgi:hypothetical protein